MNRFVLFNTLLVFIFFSKAGHSSSIADQHYARTSYNAGRASHVSYEKNREISFKLMRFLGVLETSEVPQRIVDVLSRQMHHESEIFEMTSSACNQVVELARSNYHNLSF
jgi:hypothetical protein